MDPDETLVFVYEILHNSHAGKTFVSSVSKQNNTTRNGVACVAGGIVGFSAHKQAAKPRQRAARSLTRALFKNCSNCPLKSKSMPA